jgi:hypothetical protein
MCLIRFYKGRPEYLPLSRKNRDVARARADKITPITNHPKGRETLDFEKLFDKT